MTTCVRCTLPISGDVHTLDSGPGCRPCWQVEIIEECLRGVKAQVEALAPSRAKAVALWMHADSLLDQIRRESGRQCRQAIDAAVLVLQMEDACDGTVCPTCAGSGEGYHGRCYRCHGAGSVGGIDRPSRRPWIRRGAA
jgi:hypothetical protein